MDAEKLSESQRKKSAYISGEKILTRRITQIKKTQITAEKISESRRGEKNLTR